MIYIFLYLQLDEKLRNCSCVCWMIYTADNTFIFSWLLLSDVKEDPTSDPSLRPLFPSRSQSEISKSKRSPTSSTHWYLLNKDLISQDNYLISYPITYGFTLSWLILWCIMSSCTGKFYYSNHCLSKYNTWIMLRNACLHCHIW